MKFLCEQCKAKYQIADDKVAGKTVRMKCRKCGHMIEVRAEVTETSVAKGLPEQDSKKLPGVGTRTSTLKSGLATSLTAKPPPPKGKPDALAGAFQKKVRSDQAPESTASLEMLDTNASNGWYVAINGVPVGPIRVSELRRKAANGAITEDSLVWREGLEEWRPVRSVTEIAEIVRESLMSGRPSLATPPPTGEMRSSVPPPASMSPRPAPRPPAPLAPRAPMAPVAPVAARSNVVPFTGRLATAEKREEAEDIDIDEDLEPISASSASASGSAIAAQAGATPGPLAARPSLIAADPFAVPGPALPSYTPPTVTPAPVITPHQPAAASISLSPPMLVTEQASARKPPNYIVIGMIVAFAVFGATSAVFIFKKDPPQQQPQVIIVPQQTPQPGVAPTPPTAPAPTDSAATVNLDGPTGKVATKGPSTGGARQTGGTPNTAKPLEGLGNLLDNNGPKVGGTPGGASRPPTAALSSDQVETTVRNYSTGVKRTCWDRIGVSTPSVNVNAKVTVASSGQVSAVDASGNDPVVAKCIENQVKGWHFPASGESTTVNIPFKFVRQ